MHCGDARRAAGSPPRRRCAMRPASSRNSASCRSRFRTTWPWSATAPTAFRARLDGARKPRRSRCRGMPTWRPSPRTGRRGIRQSGKRAHWPRRCSTPGTTSCCIAHWQHCGWMSRPSTRSTRSAGQARARTSRTAAAVFSPRTSSSARYPVWPTFPHRPANERTMGIVFHFGLLLNYLKGAKR